VSIIDFVHIYDYCAQLFQRCTCKGSILYHGFTELHASKVCYVESITANLHHSQKPFWNWINKVKGCCTLIPSLVCNSNVVTSDSIKATLFNDYFVSVFTQEDVSNLEELHCQLLNSLFHLDAITVSPSEVSRELSWQNLWA